jgi:hypothetical protein
VHYAIRSQHIDDADGRASGLGRFFQILKTSTAHVPQPACFKISYFIRTITPITPSQHRELASRQSSSLMSSACSDPDCHLFLRAEFSPSNTFTRLLSSSNATFRTSQVFFKFAVVFTAASSRPCSSIRSISLRCRKVRCAARFCLRRCYILN